MTRRELLKEKETISYMISRNIQKKYKPNELCDLLIRQAWLSSEIKSIKMGKVFVKIYICQVCGHIAFNNLPDKCTACGADKDKFLQNDHF